jgi:hypothetical protein
LIHAASSVEDETRMKNLLCCLLAVFALLHAAPAEAHKINASFLRLQIDGQKITGSWDIALFDLANTAHLVNKTPADFEAVKAFALDHLLVSEGADRCPLKMRPATAKEQRDEAMPALLFEGECSQPVTRLTVDYSPFLAIDPQYEALTNIAVNGQTYTAALGAQNPRFSFGESLTFWEQFRTYLREGVFHIWTGYDHILFLVSLLLSAAFTLENRAWKPRDGFGGCFIQVVKIVTAFTIAHSITLGLVIFNVINLPSRFVESTIALSIAIAAANNLKPVMYKGLWAVTFCFGLIHGMGFASALKELGLPDNAKWAALVAFNLGVEGGQLTVVAAVLPLIYRARTSEIYRQVIFRVLSVLIISVALLWFTQRAFEIKLLGGIFGD